MPVFAGARMQRGFGRFRAQTGNGLGGVLRKLFRSAVPFLIRGGKGVGRQALKTGVNIGEDIGKTTSQSKKTRKANASKSKTKKKKVQYNDIFGS